MLQVELYGVLQQAAGQRSLRLDDIGPEATVAEVLETLESRYPSLAPHLPRVACAQGDTLVRPAQTVDLGRPLVLLPPVSGG